MEGQTESLGARPAVENRPCSFWSCEGSAAVEIGGNRLCLEHFISFALGELESRSEVLKRNPFDAPAMESFKRFLAFCSEQSKRLSEDETVTDKQMRARLLEIYLRAADLGQRLRRSPRMKAAVPIWLRREDRGPTWEEETWTSTVSHHGAGLTCHHPVETGGTVVLCRRDKASRVSARVVYSRIDSEGRRQIGVELLDQPDFWD